MIKSNKGRVKVKGNFYELNADLTCIIKSVRNYCEHIGHPDYAEKMIERAVEISKMTKEELKKEMERD
jgi:hypothetical protein